MTKFSIKRNSSVLITSTAIGFIAIYWWYLQQQRNTQKPIAKTSLPTQKIINLSQLPIGGYPGPIHDAIQRRAYITSYNRQYKHPDWTFEHLTKNSFPGKFQGEPNDVKKDLVPVDRTKSRFQEDVIIPEKFRAKLVNYFKSGYDRGHMVPAGDVKTDQTSLDETFLLTNIAPQVGVGFNRDYWAHLEEFCRRLLFVENFTDVYVYTGTAYLPKKDPNTGKFYVKYEVIGNPPNISVPTHFYKVILAIKNKNQKDIVLNIDKDSKDGDDKIYALATFVLPNENIPSSTPISNFSVPLDALERTTGLTFFENLLTSKQVLHLCEVIECKLVPNPKYFANKANNDDKK
nr:6971_t:CDS:2 [Entrophospora candida]